MPTLTARALPALPEIAPGDDLGEMIIATGARLEDEHVVVVAHKAVSKAEGRIVALAQINPTPQATALARDQGQDPRAVQAVLDEAAEVIRAERGVLICRTRHGLVCANAGVDLSNTSVEGTAILLPVDPDRSARALRARLRELTGKAPAVLITDSFGRAWRHGQCDVAVGCAGLQPLEDWRGRDDRSGRGMRATWIAVADEIAAAADLVRTKVSGEPVVLVAGVERHVTSDDGPGAAALVRPLDEDLFR